MGIGFNPFHSKPIYDANCQVMITEQGKAEIDGDHVRGVSWQVLAALDQHSPQTISKLSREVRQYMRQVSKTVKLLRNQQLVKVNDFAEE